MAAQVSCALVEEQPAWPPTDTRMAIKEQSETPRKRQVHVRTCHGVRTGVGARVPRWQGPDSMAQNAPDTDAHGQAGQYGTIPQQRPMPQRGEENLPHTGQTGVPCWPLCSSIR